MSNLSDIKALRDEFGIVWDTSIKVSQFGGLKVFLDLLEKGKFFERLQKEFGSQKARTVLQTLIGLIAGAKDMEEVARVARDPIVAKFLKKGLVSAVGAIQLARDFKAFSRLELESFHRFVSGIAIAELSQELPRGANITIDVDATAVEKHGTQEGVEEGYVEKNQIESCYQYLFFRIHELDSLFYGTIRGGAAHCQNDYCGYLQRFLPVLSKDYKVTLRTDSGYFNEAAVDVYKDNDTTFFCKAPMSQSRSSFVSQSKDLNWSIDPKSGSEFSSYITRTKKGSIYREIYKRTFKKSSAQIALFEEVNYRYDCLVTNDLVIRDSQAFEAYNGRANIENSIKELKEGFALGRLITDSFDANDAITQTTLLAYAIINHLKIRYLPQEMRKFRIQTLRWKFFNLPGRMFFSAQMHGVRLKNIFCKAYDYLSPLRKIRDSMSWVLEPPPLIATI